MRKGHQAQTSSEKLPSLLLLASAPYFATILCAPVGQYSRKRKLTAVCSHQTRIGNLDAHLI